MGLPTGPHGVKELVKTRCSASWKEHATLKEAREAQGVAACDACCILDGNVLVRQVPTAATTFEEYTAIFSRFVEQALRAAHVVAVVFDEPAVMSKAKAAEQARRDAQSKKGAIVMSADLAETLAPTTDDYDYGVATEANPHEIMRSRAARSRIFDAICKHTMNKLMDHSKEHEGKTLIFDGIDPRGASRPIGDTREPMFYSNDDRAAALLTRRPGAPIVAEGDLKITDVEAEMQMLRDTGKYFVSIDLFLVCTIDTDSIAIELCHQSAKNACRVHPPVEGERPPPRTLLCFREAPPRKRKPDDENEDAPPAAQPAKFACFDVAAMHKAIVEVELGAPSGFHRHATALLASVWALCGSDFVHMNGMRSDVAFEAVSDLCRSKNGPALLSQMEAAWELRRDTDPKTLSLVRNNMLQPISTVVEGTRDRLKGMPRMGKSVKAINNTIEDEYVLNATLLKAAWVAVYWSGLQCTNDELRGWGF